MKKIIPVLVVLVLLAVGGYYYMNSKKTMPSSNSAIVKTESAATGNVFTSIQDALSRSLTLECNYKDDKGTQTTTYVKGGAVRVVMSAMADPKQPNNVIVKDKKMYMWNDTTKAGFTYTMTEPAVTGTSPVATGQPAASDKQASFLATIEKYKNACKTSTVADSFFQVPIDVNFQDMNAFTKQIMNNIPSQPVGGQNAVDYQNYINQMKQQGAGQ